MYKFLTKFHGFILKVTSEVIRKIHHTISEEG